MSYQFDPALNLPCPKCGSSSREAVRDHRVCVGVVSYPRPEEECYPEDEIKNFGLISLCIDDKNKEPYGCCSWDEGRYASREEADHEAEDFDAKSIRRMSHENEVWDDDGDFGPPDSDPYDREPLQF